MADNPEQLPVPVDTVSLGQEIDQIQAVRVRKRKIEDQLKEVSEEYAALQQKLIDRMREEGISRASGRKATASWKPGVRPHVVDWDLVNEFIHKHKYYHLYERRLSAASWTELCEKRKGKLVPGTEPFIYTTLSLRDID